MAKDRANRTRKNELKIYLSDNEKISWTGRWSCQIQASQSTYRRFGVSIIGLILKWSKKINLIKERFT